MQSLMSAQVTQLQDYERVRSISSLKTLGKGMIPNQDALGCVIYCQAT